MDLCEIRRSNNHNTRQYRVPRCHLCWRLGHTVRRFTSRTCQNCQQRGHIDRNFPEKKFFFCYYCKEFGHRKNTCPWLLQRQQEERTAREATGIIFPPPEPTIRHLILKIIDNPNGNEIMQHITYAEVIKIYGGPDPVTKVILTSIDLSIQELEGTKITAKAYATRYRTHLSKSDTKLGYKMFVKNRRGIGQVVVAT